MKRLFEWIINTYSYIQIYSFIYILFLLSFIPIVLIWMFTNYNRLGLIDEQLEEIQKAKELKELFAAVQQHRLLKQRYEYSEDKNSLQQMINFQKQTHTELFKEKGLLISRERAPLRNSLWHKIDLFDLYKRWNDLLDNSSATSSKNNEYVHTAFLQDMRIEFGYLADRVGISIFSHFDQYIFTQSISLSLVSLQDSLSEIILLSEKIFHNVNRDLANAQITALLDVVDSNLLYLSEGMDSYVQEIPSDYDQKNLINLLKQYLASVKEFATMVQENILHLPEPNVSLQDFQLKAQALIDQGYHLWDQSLTVLIQIFKNEKKLMLIQFGIVFLATLLLMALAFYLGLKLTKAGIKRLSQLTQATDSFTNGDLTVRVPDNYQDDIGRQAKAFNRMAQRLAELINHLYELLNATSALAKGKLNARISSVDSNHEFDEVATSFNKMAETFEMIISRLQRLGMTLTTSASEISSASKEQETIVVEQEATTREIAIAANEISSTAKEFAITMNEVSQAADQTSDLALKGKRSLNNMETIMHSMVDASSKIANKLTILSEKAGNITSVITTITKVADQTNLLSLNASIEAEKAGEYGRSFAVIAREIKRLADQTAVATLDVEAMVSEITAAVSTSVMGVEEFNHAIRKGVEQVRSVSEQLTTIIEHVEAFTARFELVNQGMQAQSTGAEQINEAIGQLSQTARQTTEAIHQFHKTVQGLNQAAHELSILNPFVSSSDEDLVAGVVEKKFSLSPTKKATGEVRSTISNLNLTTSKLKDLNDQLKPPS